MAQLGPTRLVKENQGMKRQPTPPKSPLPRVAFDSRETKGLDGFAVWQELCRPAYEATALQPDRPFDSAFQFYSVYGLVFNQASYGATRYQRTRRHIGQGESDHLVLQLLLRGSEHVRMPSGAQGQLAPDRIVLRDWAHPFRSESTAAEQISVMIPRHLVTVSDVTYESHPILSWSLDSLPGRLLGTAITQIWENLPHLESTEAPTVASGFLGLLNGLVANELSDEVRAETHKPVTVQAMKTYLLRHLSDPGLGVNQLVEAFRCSRTTVYRLFQDSGGVAEFIREQRLDACLEELTRPGGESLAIRDVSQSFGFDDNAYFHRAFKKRFGLTPREAQESAGMPNALVQPTEATSGDGSPSISFIHTWSNLTRA